MIPKEDYRYIVMSNSTVEVIEVQYKDKTYLVTPKLLFESDKELMTKEDAQYELFRKNMEKGKALKKYRTSKYYKMYIKRAQIENPEFLI